MKEPHVITEAEEAARAAASRSDYVVIRIAGEGHYQLTAHNTADPELLGRRLKKAFQELADNPVILTHLLGGCIDPDCTPRCRY